MGINAFLFPNLLLSLFPPSRQRFGRLRIRPLVAGSKPNVTLMQWDGMGWAGLVN